MQVTRLVRPGRVFAATLACVLVGGCAFFQRGPKVETPPPPPQPTKIGVKIICTADGNRCGNNPAPLNFKVIQLSDTSMSACRVLRDCWGQEAIRFGGSLLDMVGDYVSPTDIAKREWKLELNPKPGVKAVLVLGNFCNPLVTWYRMVPVTKKVQISLIAGPDGFKEQQN